MENLDSETKKYIINHFYELLSFKEKAELKMSFSKHQDKERYDKDFLAKILEKGTENIHFNNCPQCGKLARTPQAKQCRYCGFDWH